MIGYMEAIIYFKERNTKRSKTVPDLETGGTLGGV